ncbi:suppressor of fused domain protein [Olivibacter ginsenosidimutans]|uniref:suppressor of fused domain protein n=1 Tax=Olivibacter ginsenosidimutans TaxID=1176537 RepID=UPI0031EE803E
MHSDQASEKVYFYWLIPIMEEEVDFKKKYGIERLEEIFEANRFDYIDPFRKSVV